MNQSDSMFLSCGMTVRPKKTETVYAVCERLGVLEQAAVFDRIFGLKHCPLSCFPVEYWVHLALCHTLNKSHFDPEEYQAFLYAHTGEVNTTYASCIVSECINNFKLTNALGWGSSLGKCTSAFMLMQSAQVLLQIKSAPILLAIGDVAFTRVLQMIPGTCITTDGAFSMVISKEAGDFKVEHIEIIVDGAFSRGNWMEGEHQKQFEQHYPIAMAECIQKSCQQANIALNEVNWIMPHNVNRISWQKVCKLLPYSMQQVYLAELPKTAHCFGVDPFANLYHAFHAGHLGLGDKVLCVTAGLGASYAAMLCTVCRKGGAR